MKKRRFLYLSAVVVMVVIAVVAALLVRGRLQLTDKNAPTPKDFQPPLQPAFQPPPERPPADPNPPGAKEPQSADQGSIVNFSTDAAKQTFLKANGLAESDLEPTAASSFVVNQRVDGLELPAGTTAYPNRQYRTILTPNDPRYTNGSQWHLNKISGPSAWDISTGSASVTIAVIDTGFALNHEDLSSKWATNSGEVGAGKETNGVDDDGNGKVDDWRGWDFVCNNNSPQAGDSDCDSSPNSGAATHGTLTAGAAAAAANNAVGVASVDWTAKILPLQALADSGFGTSADVADAIDYAVARGAKVISMSLGGTDPDSFTRQRIDAAVAAGVVVIAAAGNCGDPATYWINGCDFVGQMLDPGNYSPVIAVGATDSNDNRASFSSYGSTLDIAAPGVSIVTSAWSNGNQTTAYGSASGTSLATPLVAGAAALYKAVAPSASVSDVESALENSAEKVAGMGSQNFTNFYGFGRLNAQGTLKWASLVHADGTLVLHPVTHGVYRIENGTKRLIPDIPTFLSYYRDVLAQSKPATPADLTLPDGTNIPIRSGTAVKGSGPALYLLAYSGATLQKRVFPSPTVRDAVGYQDPSEWIPVSDSYLQGIADGAVMTATEQHVEGTLVRQEGQLTVYLIQNNTKRTLRDVSILIAINKGKYSVKPANAADLALATGSDLGFEEGALIKGSTPAVYMVDDAAGTLTKLPFASPYVLYLYGFRHNDWIQTQDQFLPSATGATIQ